MRYHRIPDETINRLPIYLRGLLFLSQQKQETVSSQDIAGFLGLNSWQIRKDFSYFGDFGTPGVGYTTENLINKIKKILNLDTVHKTALVGVGNLGSAVLAYSGFRDYNFELVAAFDNDPEKIGRKINDVIVDDVSSLKKIKELGVSLAIIAVLADSAQQITDLLVEAGVVGILNFSPCYITVPKKVKVITINIAMYLARLPYYIPSKKIKKPEVTLLV